MSSFFNGFRNTGDAYLCLMTAANLQLSPEEIRLMTDPGWILTKNSIIVKIVELFAGLSEEYRSVWEGGNDPRARPALLGSAAFASSPKISKGENYRGLPYVMLDYPRLFGKEDVLAIRTMFWWGHAFSTTLHLKGRYRELYLPVIRERWNFLAACGFHIGISEDEWRHEHVPENYLPMDGPPGEGGRSFLKLSARCGLDKWEEAPAVLTGHFRVLVGVLDPNYLNDGKGL
jgi:hypothetical protein